MSHSKKNTGFKRLKILLAFMLIMSYKDKTGTWLTKKL